MFRIIFALIVITGLFASTKAYACLCGPNDEEYILKNAQFIGVVSVVEAEKIQHFPLAKDDPEVHQKIIERTFLPAYVYKFKILETFKGEIPLGEAVYSGGTNCDHPEMKINTIDRVILFKNKDEKLYLSGHCANLKQEEWVKLEKEISPRRVPGYETEQEYWDALVGPIAKQKFCSNFFKKILNWKYCLAQ